MSDLVNGPVTPTPRARQVLAPLPLNTVTLDRRTYLSQWQQRSARHTLPHCVEQLEAAGNLGNLRAAAGRSDESFTGLWFADSDVYKTLEAALWQQTAGDDRALERFVDSAADLLRDAQEVDGYLNSWFQLRADDDRWSNLKWGHELYCIGHLIQAAVAAVRTGRAPELVTVARAAADLVVTRFGPGAADGICGHPEIETALVELYRATGHQPYLGTAAKMVELRGRGSVGALNRPLGVGDDRFGPAYFQDHEPLRSAGEATGHAVRQLYLDAGVVDVAVETGDDELLAASEARWNDLFGAKTYITGAHGSRHRDEAIGDAFELPPDRAYAESCAAIASFQWNWRLLLATGDHRYADEMERVLLNAIAGATAHDGRHFFYSNPLHLRAGHPVDDEDAPSSRLRWFTCSCCPPNLARLLASINGYAVTTDEGGVQVHLLSGLRVSSAVPGGSVNLQIDSDYPWDGRLRVTVASCSTQKSWTLSVRIPSWADQPVVEVNGQRHAAAVDRGYLRLHRVWQAGDSLTVVLPMQPRAIAAHPHVDAVRGCVALARGPLVYCVEQADLPDGVALADVRVDPGSVVALRDSDILGAPVVLRVDGWVSNVPVPPALYRTLDDADEPAGHHRVELTAVPYFAWGNRDSDAMRVWLPVHQIG